MRSSTTFQDSEGALSPDPGTEADFRVENNKFAFTPGHMNKLLNPKSLPAFVALGGLAGIERGLRTNIDSGLSIDEGDLEGTVTFEEAAKTQKIKGDGAPTLGASGGQSGSYADRIRVFKNNVIPTRKATPIWKLMWLAYKDPVLLLLSAAATISLSLGVSLTRVPEFRSMLTSN